MEAAGMDLDLTGKIALVTGSTRGIGLATAKGLAGMGAQVIVNGRTQAAVDRATGDIQQVVADATPWGVAADVSTAAGCETVIEAHPKVDILVNNTGVYGPKPFFEIADEDWQQIFDINVMSGVRLTRHYLKRMLEDVGGSADGSERWGRVIFVSSEASSVVPVEMVHYGFSKGAQQIIARGAAETTKGTGVTVNSVLPGPTWVEASPKNLEARARLQGTTVEDVIAKAFTERRPTSLIQRYATVEEVANLICYLCSKASSATNGAALRVDGGIIGTPY
jgi:NAD(P)-dependent dehydrogenase (short-subunit alcohol dehydrogenase family)